MRALAFRSAGLASLGLAVLLGSLGVARADDDLLACGTPADGEEATRKDRAKEHFDRGEELYAAGEYELAIPEYHAAYCLLPNPDPIYNIGQAYERLVDYEKAVVWFEEYIHQLPPDRTDEINRVGHRVAVLRKLPAKVRVSTDPPGAAITLQRVDTEGDPIHGKANSKDPLRIAAGSYTMRVELPGYLSASETFTAQIGQPYTYSYRLTPKTGRLEVSAFPGDARIFVDGRIAGIGTYSDRLSIGRHAVTVEAAGRPSEERFVDLSSDFTTTVHVKMQPTRPKNGRVELLIASTLAGTAYGSAIAAVLGANPEVTSTAALGGAALGFFTPYAFLPDYIPVGRTSFVIGGTYWGALEGYELSVLITGPDSGVSDHELLRTSLAVGGSLLLGGGSLLLTERWHVSTGDAALINSGGVWGSGMALLTWSAFGSQDSLAAPFTLAGLNLGLLVGALVGTRTEYSRTHVAFIDLAGFAGLVAGTALAGVSGATGDSSARFGLGGTTIGLILGAVITRNYDAEPDVTASIDSATDTAGADVPTYGLTMSW